MTTAARTYDENSTHWYTKAGVPFFEIPKADGSGMRSPTVADARKLGLLPGVTHITRLLDKPELASWKMEQACLAVLTTPRKEGEGLDAFVRRVLHEEMVQEEEAKKARELGSAIHDALALALTGQDWDRALEPYIAPVLEWQKSCGRVVWTEKVLAGEFYAGRADALLENEDFLGLVDFKTTGKLPAKSYREHQLQTAAYANLLGNTAERRILTTNVYISTKEPGKFVVRSQVDWRRTYEKGFVPLLNVWRWANDMPEI